MFGIVLAIVNTSACSCCAEGRGEQRAADEAAEPGDHRAGGHHRARGQHARVGVVLAPRRRPVRGAGHVGLLSGRGVASPGRSRVGSVRPASRGSRGPWVALRRRIRRNSRTAIATNSSTPPAAMITQITVLDPAGADAELGQAAERVPVGVGGEQRHGVHADVGRGGLEPDRGALAGAERSPGRASSIVRPELRVWAAMPDGARAGRGR